MSQDSSFLKHTLDLLEKDPEVKSFIYQQMLDFNQFVTPETLVVVLARDPSTLYNIDQDVDTEEDLSVDTANEEDMVEKKFKHRIAVLLKDGDNSIEAEGFSNDIFDAISSAKNNLIDRLVQIQEEVESPQERMNAIRDASNNSQIH